MSPLELLGMIVGFVMFHVFNENSGFNKSQELRAWSCHGAKKRSTLEGADANCNDSLNDIKESKNINTTKRMYKPIR